jgi:hypothetical protein
MFMYIIRFTIKSECMAVNGCTPEPTIEWAIAYTHGRRQTKNPIVK